MSNFFCALTYKVIKSDYVINTNVAIDIAN